ncbi:hypothetical protein [Salinimonas iocasae]|uniref:hypothetical protein n=1 Tax=Salinimonas iocasae TaxID=2572577 RepID=UPI00143D0886|nr:hypothetical protein [Salinimonas iocasae]
MAMKQHLIGVKPKDTYRNRNHDHAARLVGLTLWIAKFLSAACSLRNRDVVIAAALIED